MEYKAPDGRVFETRKEMNDHIINKFFSIVEKQNDTIVKLPNEISKLKLPCKFTIANLKKCEVYVMDILETVECNDLEDCRVFVGPCKSSVKLENCSNSIFFVVCQQFRTRNCQNCTFFLLCDSAPGIESSSDIKIGELKVHYDGFEEQLDELGMPNEHNNWNRVHDFSAPEVDSPNWKIIDEAQYLDLSHFLFKREFNDRVAQLDEEEEIKKEQLRESGVTWTDNFFEERVNRMLTRAKTNREKEENFIQDISESESGCSNPWERVLSLIDTSFNEKNERMRRLIISMGSKYNGQ